MRVLLVLGLVLGASVADAQTQRKPAPTPAARPAPPKPIRYAKRGLPARRVGSGVRGGPIDAAVRVLGPRDHVGQTLDSTPVLYWVFLADSGAAPAAAELTITGGGETKTVKLDAAQPWIASAIDLGRVGVRLRDGVDYRWLVRLVDVDHPSDSAWIRIAPAPVRRSVQSTGDDLLSVRALAEHGVWYDALARLQRLVERDDREARLLRDGLLERELGVPRLKR